MAMHGSQGGWRFKAGLLFNYLIHNHLYSTHLSRRGALSGCLMEARHAPVQVECRGGQILPLGRHNVHFSAENNESNPEEVAL